MAADARLTRAQAAKALDSFIDGVQSSLEHGRRVTLVGFGTFVVSERKARHVRDPRNGETMLIEARRVARFAPGLELKDAIERAAREPNGRP
jgi:DNA-binding protein HU-beta